MRYLLPILFLLAPVLHAERDWFGELARYEWYEVRTIADVESLPATAVAVKCVDADDKLLKALSGCSFVEALDVSSFRGLDGLPELPKLRLLKCSFSNTTAGVVGNLAQLETLLCVDYNPGIVSDESWACLAELKNLHTLALGGSIATNEIELSVATFKAISQLTQLRRLHLYQAILPDISDFRPYDFGGLHELVFEMNILGTFDLTEFLSQMTSLKSLSLSYGDGDQNPPWVEVLPSLGKLTRLAVAGRAAEGLLGGELAGIQPLLQRLEYVSLCDTMLSSTFLASCPNLRELTLDNAGGTEKADIEALSKLSSLERLTLGGHFASDLILAQFATLPRLRSIVLREAPFSDETDLPTLSGDSFRFFDRDGPLRELVIRRASSLSTSAYKAIGRLTLLETLVLDRCKRATVALPYLKGCESLKRLAILDSEVVPVEQLRALGELTKLERLALSCDLGLDTRDAAGAAVKALVQCKEIEVLVLEGYMVRAADIQMLAQLTKLKQLRIDPAELDAPSVQALSKLESLEWLEVWPGGDQAQAASIEPLTKLPHLKRLAVQMSYLSDESLKQLRELDTGHRCWFSNPFLLLPRLWPSE